MGSGRIAKAASKGDTTELYASLRDKVAASVYDDAVRGRDLTALAGQLHALVGEDLGELRRLRQRMAEAADDPSLSTRDLAAVTLRIRLLTEDILRIEEGDTSGDDLTAAGAEPDEEWDGSLDPR